MKNIFPILFFCILIYSCAAPSPKNETNTDAQNNSVQSTLQGKPTFIVTEPEILFLWPDSATMALMKVQDSDAFYTGADDYSFYTAQTMDLADSIDVKTETTNKNVIDFITTGNKHFQYNRKGKDTMQWGAFLFNGIDAPVFEASIDIDRARMKSFFKK